MGVGGEVGMESITEPKEVPEEKANLCIRRVKSGSDITNVKIKAKFRM